MYPVFLYPCESVPVYIPLYSVRVRSCAYFIGASSEADAAFQKFARFVATTSLFMFHIFPVPVTPVRVRASHVLLEAIGYHDPESPTWSAAY